MSAPAATERRRLHEVDVVRVSAVALVVGAHTAAAIQLTTLAGAAVMLFHVSRETFFMVTAFVLMYGYARTAVRWPAFWRKRWVLVGVPYVVWTVIYFAVSGVVYHSLTASWSTAGSLGANLLTGTGGYQLYFLVVSLQIYLVFPVLRWLIRSTQRHHALLLCACAAFQIVFSLAVQMQWQVGIVSAWLRGPDAILLSYLFYIVAGAIAAWHADAFLAWTRQHARAVLAGAAVTIGLSIATYAVQLTAGGMSPNAASAVFQPVLVFESVAVAWALLTIGLLWADGRMARRTSVLALSDRSFGVYLMHPLLLAGALALMTATGVLGAVQQMPAVAQLVVLLVVVAPVTYAAAAILTGVFRKTPLSLALAGRPRHQRTRAARRAVLEAIPAAQPSEVAA